ncbi:MAG: hypothetical protein RLZZ282_498 [Verrucomicrobiota bacterium]|jgi:hypothetical protein
MQTMPKTTLVPRWLACLPLCLAAALLLGATWIPVIEIKGFDTFSLESVAMWATRAARVTLLGALLCLLLRPLGVSRWAMALSVGILIGPLADMGVRAMDLARMMETEGPGDFTGLIVVRAGTWICMAGLVFWLLDLAIACAGLLRSSRCHHA